MFGVDEGKSDNVPPCLEEINQQCQICYDTSDGIHFGTYTCRACAAFFRRTVSLRLEYTCRGQTQCAIDKSARNMCRACRYQKCLNVGMQVSAVQLARDGIGKRTTVKSQASRPSTSVAQISLPPAPTARSNGITQESLSFPSVSSAFTAVQSNEPNMVLLPKMYEGYLHFLTIRRATHSLIENENLTELFRKPDGELRPSNFDSAKKVCQLEAHLVTDIVNTYFHPFDQIPYTEKVILFKNFFCYLSHTDRAYQSYKMFGHDEENDRLLMSDGGYIKSRELEKFYANAKGVHSQPEEAARIFRPAMEFILRVIIAHMRRICITDIEYMAILGFFLWNEAVPSLSPETVEKVYATQEVILNDLHTHYRKRGFDETQITKKTGQLMLILPKLTRSVVMMRENSELAEMFNIFEADVCCKSFKGDQAIIDKP